MYSSSTLGVLVGTLFLIASIPDAASYTKYGRTCKDIGCRRDEVCVMAEDPCSIYQRDNCGRYPTCAKVQPGGANCETTVCHENEYCKTENGMPTCVKRTSVIGYESAGVSSVNGQRINTDSNNDNHDKISNTGTNTNPYANANAPPAEPAGGYRPVSSGTNLGYPPYPSNTGTNNGYPAYPQPNQGNRQQDLGYPPYPTQNRMPMPVYPGQQNPGYPVPPGYPQAPGYPQQYPGHQNYPYSNFPNYNRAHHDNVHSVYRYKGSASERSVSPSRTSGRHTVKPPPPPPPPRSSSYGFGGRNTGNSGSRNTIGNGSIFNRLFGDDRNSGSRTTTTLRPKFQQGGSGYYNSHTSVDANGNRVWTFSG